MMMMMMMMMMTMADNNHFGKILREVIYLVDLSTYAQYHRSVINAMVAI